MSNEEVMLSGRPPIKKEQSHDDVNNATRVNIVAGSTSGTQYADGAARGTATGTLGMVDDGTSIQSMKGDTSGRPLVTIDTALPAGTALIGKAGIDQTTPGTTNKVSIGTDGTVGVTGSVAVTGTFFQATQPVSAVALPLPTGAATEASLSVIAGSITATVAQTNTKQINGVAPSMGSGITGTGVQRVVLATDVALPAGTNAIGKLAANSGVDIGDVDVLTMPGIAGSTAHDAVGTSVNPVASGGYASAAAPTAVSADGDVVRAWRLHNGAAAAVLTAAGALIAGDAANGLDIDPTRPWPGSNISGTAGSLNADAIASTDVSRYSGISVQVSGTFSGTMTVQVSNDNTTWFSLPLFDCATTVGAPYSGITGPSMSTGSFNFNFLRIRMTSYTSGSATVNATLQAQSKSPFTGGFYAFGQGAEGSAPNGNPLLVANRVRTALPTAEADGDIMMPMLDKYTRSVMVQNAPRDLRAAQTTTLANTTETTCVTAAGASVFADVEEVSVTNTGAATVTVTFKDATAGTTRFSIAVLVGTTQQLTFKAGWPQATANNNWTATSSSATGDALVSVVYHKNK